MRSDSQSIAIVRPAGPTSRVSSEVAAAPAIIEARAAMRAQANSLLAMAERLDGSFAAAVGLVLATEGRVVVIGVGKSGIIGHKVASTLASTGTPSLFVNAAEARHGDLGMITSHDLAVLVSSSGETEEVIALLPHLRALQIPLIALVGRIDSSLAKSVDVVLDVSVDGETCPNNLAPTTSTLATLSMGDALAVALMRERKFGAEDFRRTHPGGSLGRRVGTRVRDVMRTADLPMVCASEKLGRALDAMSEGQLGLVMVMAGERLVGLITDGDLRRAMLRGPGTDLRDIEVSDIMTCNPATISDQTPLDDAVARMNSLKLKAFIALGDTGKVTGVVEVFDARSTR